MRISLAVTFALSVVPCAAYAQAQSRMPATHDTLPRFAAVTAATSDSASLVTAADDALQGKFGITAPMVVIRFHRAPTGVEISLKPDETPGISWEHLGGTVRVLPDGRRAILRRF